MSRLTTGKLKTPFLLQSCTLAPDGSATWSTLTAIWGSLEPAHIAADGQAAAREVTHHVHLRANQNFEITPGQRLSFNGRNFLILSVIDLHEEGKWLRLFVREDKGLE